MARIDVIAKVTGVHAATGMGLKAGETYTIEDKDFGDEVFKRVPEQEPSATRKRAVPSGKEEG